MTVAALHHNGNSNALNGIYMDVLRQAYAEFKSAITASPRHQEWFHGRTLSADATDSMERTVALRVSEKMKQHLHGMGEKNYDQFVSKLAKFPHQLRKSVAPGLIPGHITHGACRFAQTVEKHSNTYEVVRFFVTNGEVAIDPAKGDRYLTLLDRSQEKVMYYGLAQTLDRGGNFIGINRDKGDDGVMFLTDDKREALFNIAAISTNRTPDDFRRLVTAPIVSQAPTAPRF
jgi:hypothetical protein